MTGGEGLTSLPAPVGSSGARRGSLPILDLVPVALVVVAESAWVSVVGGFIQEVRLQAPVLGIPALTAFVVFGLVAARTLGPRLGARWAFVGLGLSLAAGALGWLIAPDARAALFAGDLRTAIGENPGGWVAGLAVLRGYANATFPISESTPARMLRLGIPGLAIIAVTGGAVIEPWRGIFLDDTLVAAVVFIACGTFALAFARQRTVGSDLHVDWRRNRAWIASLVGAVVVATVVALASAGVIGEAIPLLLGLALGPIVIVGLVFGTTRRTIRFIGLFVAVALFIYLVAQAFMAAQPPAPPPGAGGGTPTSPETNPTVMVGLGGLGVILALIAVLILIRLWMGQVGPIEEDPNEIRTIDHGVAPEARGRRRRRRGHPTPVDAQTAYLALVADIARQEAIRREPVETPAEHARRLRGDGVGDLGLDLLAADYALAAFGGVGLTPREDRRAVDRWRRLRHRLGRA